MERVKSIILNKRTLQLAIVIATLVSHLAVLQVGHSLGRDQAFGQWAAWEEICQEHDLDALGADGTIPYDDPWPVTCIFYRLQQTSYLAAEPDLGSAAENSAR